MNDDSEGGKDVLREMNLCSLWLIVNLCVKTNAEEATITHKQVHHEGKILGDYEITIRKV